MPQFIKKREEDPQGSTSSENPNEPPCPKCGSRKTTIAGTIPGHIWLRCDACGFHFSIDAEAWT